VDVADARLPHGILAHIGDYESGNEYHNLIQNKDYTAARLWLIINKYPVHKDDIQWKRGEPLFPGIHDSPLADSNIIIDRDGQLVEGHSSWSKEPTQEECQPPDSPLSDVDFAIEFNRSFP